MRSLRRFLTNPSHANGGNVVADFILRLIVIALVVPANASASDKRNVLLLTADDLGIQLSC